MKFSSNDDFYAFVEATQQKLNQEGFIDSAERLFSILRNGHTTSSEVFGEIGLTLQAVAKQNIKTLIKNGQIVTAVDDYRADILIEDETISVIGKTLDMEADVVIDASEKLVIPGGIDPHTHMELPFGGTSSSDDFFTGTRAA